MTRTRRCSVVSLVSLEAIEGRFPSMLNCCLLEILPVTNHSYSEPFKPCSTYHCLSAWSNKANQYNFDMVLSPLCDQNYLGMFHNKEKYSATFAVSPWCTLCSKPFSGSLRRSSLV